MTVLPHALPANPFPARIRTIGLVSPASQPNKEEVEAVMEVFRAWGIRPVLAPHALDPGTEPYVCGSIESRASDFNAVIHDESVDLVCCTRGGYGSAQILPLIDWDALRERNLPVLGYSDITAVLLAMLKLRAGIPIATVMAEKIPTAMCKPETAAALRLALAGGTPRWTLPSVANIAPGEILHGRAVACNLSILVSLCGTPFLPDFRNRILIVEDVDEPVRKLDRSLTQLMLAGVLSRIRALVFASLTDCGEFETQLAMMRKFAALSGKPVLRGLPFGHEFPTHAVPCGRPVRIEAA